MVKKVTPGVKEKYCVFSVKLREASVKRLDKIADKYRWSRGKTIDALAEFYDRVLDVLDARERVYDMWSRKYQEGESLRDGDSALELDLGCRNALGDLCQFGLLGPDRDGFWNMFIEDCAKRFERKKK